MSEVVLASFLFPVRFATKDSLYDSCLPHSGSSDKTVKFWDLETFELIGSTGPEVCKTLGFRYKALLCLQDRMTFSRHRFLNQKMLEDFLNT